jgi:hypothetical protein
MRQLLSYARPGFDQVPSPGFGEKYRSLSGTFEPACNFPVNHSENPALLAHSASLHPLQQLRQLSHVEATMFRHRSQNLRHFTPVRLSRHRE